MYVHLQTDSWTFRQLDKQTAEKTDSWTFRQLDKQTAGQTDI